MKIKEIETSEERASIATARERGTCESVANVKNNLQKL